MTSPPPKRPANVAAATSATTEILDTIRHRPEAVGQHPPHPRGRLGFLRPRLLRRRDRNAQPRRARGKRAPLHAVSQYRPVLSNAGESARGTVSAPSRARPQWRMPYPRGRDHCRGVARQRLRNGYGRQMALVQAAASFGSNKAAAMDKPPDDARSVRSAGYVSSATRDPAVLRRDLGRNRLYPFGNGHPILSLLRTLRAGVKEAWKRVAHSRTPNQWQRYNLADDRTEIDDRTRLHPDKSERLAAAWAQWSARVGAPESKAFD